jgi:hypothetical protein
MSYQAYKNGGRKIIDLGALSPGPTENIQQTGRSEDKPLGPFTKTVL